MTSLTRISIITRKTIRYGVYAIITIIIARAALIGLIRIYRHFFPAPPIPPTVEFGVLPTLPFPKRDIPDLVYTLETPDGELPEFDYLTKVYFMPKLATHLLSLESAKQKASRLGYLSEGAEVTETVYKFSHEDVPSELQISITTGVFAISYDLTQDPTPLKKRPFPPEVAAEKARSILSTKGIMPDDLSGPTISEPVKLKNKKIVRANSLSEAHFVKVSFFRRAYDELSAMTPDYDIGNVWFIISGETQLEKQVIAAEFHHFPIDETKFATYPIKTSLQAWEDILAGKGYVAKLGSVQDSVVIRNVYLGYYDPGVSANFYQPVVVFEGDNNFVAYVPAVTDEYYGP